MSDPKDEPREPEAPIEHDEKDPERREQHVDEASEESFPASDPPAFTPEKGGKD